MLCKKVTDDCISAGHVSHVPKNRRNDARAKRFSTNSWKYNNTEKYILMKYIYEMMENILVKE